MKANEFQRAIEAYQKAHDIMHVPTTGMALARAHLAAGHLVEARDAALEVGRLPHDAADPAVFDTARKHAKELDKELKARIPMLRVKVKGGTASKVTIDETEIPASIIGEPVAVNPGKHVVVARAADGPEAKGEIEIAEREAKEIELAFGAPVEAKPKPVVVTPPPPPDTPPKVTPPPSEEVPGERTPLARGLIYGGLGVGALGLAVGAVTGVLTLSKASDVKPLCSNEICDPAAQGDLDSANTFATIATTAFIVGGVGVVAGIVGFVLPRDAPVRPMGGGIGGTFW
jgi:hypothetical protein